MSIFKSMVLSVLLVVPMLGNAAFLTTTQFASGTSNFVATPSYTGTGGSLVTQSASTVNFTDNWTLNVAAGEQADIGFTTNPLTISGLKIWDINNFLVDNASLLNLSAGTYNYKVTGDVVGAAGGSYLVGTVVSAVPVPAAMWLMGSALVGLVSFSRRKAGLAA